MPSKSSYTEADEKRRELETRLLRLEDSIRVHEDVEETASRIFRDLEELDREAFSGRSELGFLLEAGRAECQASLRRSIGTAVEGIRDGIANVRKELDSLEDEP